MTAATRWWDAFPKQVARAIEPLEQRGFRLVKVDAFPPEGAAQRARVESDAVGIDIWLDPRGELDAKVGRLSAFGEGYYAYKFGPSADPLLVQPPYMFGSSQG